MARFPPSESGLFTSHPLPGRRAHADQAAKAAFAQFSAVFECRALMPRSTATPNDGRPGTRNSEPGIIPCPGSRPWFVQSHQTGKQKQAESAIKTSAAHESRKE